MNEKRERFCREYAASGNATQAAINAGYSRKTAKSQGQRLLTFVDVQAYIEELTEAARSEKIADIAKIQEFWTAIFQDATAKTADRLKASELLARSQGAFLFRVSEEPGGEDVVIYLPDNGRDHVEVERE